MARLLLVDDNIEFRDALAQQLRSVGHDVITPNTGSDALKTAALEPYDLAITDVVMPEVDGVEIVRAIRAAKPSCPIIAISGGSPRLPAAFGLKLTEAFGADAVLYKPFSIRELIGAINKLM